MYAFADAALALPNEPGRYFYKHPLRRGAYLLDLVISKTEEVPEVVRAEHREECAPGRVVPRLMRLYYFGVCLEGGFAAGDDVTHVRYKYFKDGEDGGKDSNDQSLADRVRMTHWFVSGFLDRLAVGQLVRIESLPDVWAEKYQECLKADSAYRFVFDFNFIPGPA